MDEPPTQVLPAAPTDGGEVSPTLPTQEQADGSLLIDLTPLAQPPTMCTEEVEPDPFNPEIVVCAKVELSPRIGPDYGPSAAELVEGSAIPRARARLSEHAELQANVANQSVGGVNANGAEVRLKIDF